MVDSHTLTPDLGSILDQGVVHQEKLREVECWKAKLNPLQWTSQQHEE